MGGTVALQYPIGILTFYDQRATDLQLRKQLITRYACYKIFKKNNIVTIQLICIHSHYSVDLHT